MFFHSNVEFSYLCLLVICLLVCILRLFPLIYIISPSSFARTFLQYFLVRLSGFLYVYHHICLYENTANYILSNESSRLFSLSELFFSSNGSISEIKSFLKIPISDRWYWLLELVIQFYWDIDILMLVDVFVSWYIIYLIRISISDEVIFIIL